MPDDVGPRFLNVVLTAQCNLRCAYCYQNAKNSRRMDWTTLQAALDLLLASGRWEVGLAFYGGEPLLEMPNIRRAVQYVERRRGRTAVAYRISTNGVLVDDEVLAFLAAHRFRIQISFDGVERAQDRRGTGTFPVLVALLDRLRRRYPLYFESHVNVGVTVTGATVPVLSDSIALLLRMGVADVRVAPASHHDSTWKAPMIEDLDRQFERVRGECLRHYRRTGAMPLGLFRRTREEPPCAPDGRAMCGLERGEGLTVDVDGRAFRCVTLVESYQEFPSALLSAAAGAMRLGDVRDPTLSERLRRRARPSAATRIFEAKRDKHSSYGRCSECPYFGDCAVCPVSIGHIPGNADPDRVPDLPCAFERVALAHRAKMPVLTGPDQILRGSAPIPELVAELMRFEARADEGRGGRE